MGRHFIFLIFLHLQKRSFQKGSFFFQHMHLKTDGVMLRRWCPKPPFYPDGILDKWQHLSPRRWTHCRQFIRTKRCWTSLRHGSATVISCQTLVWTPWDVSGAGRLGAKACWSRALATVEWGLWAAGEVTCTARPMKDDGLDLHVPGAGWAALRGPHVNNRTFSSVSPHVMSHVQPSPHHKCDVSWHWTLKLKDRL